MGTAMAGSYAAFFVPKSSGGGVAAKDALGNDVKAQAWLATHQPHTYELTQGLKGDPTYLVVTDGGAIESYGINSICTHLGCVVPWNAARTSSSARATGPSMTSRA